MFANEILLIIFSYTTAKCYYKNLKNNLNFIKSAYVMPKYYFSKYVLKELNTEIYQDLAPTDYYNLRNETQIYGEMFFSYYNYDSDFVCKCGFIFDENYPDNIFYHSTHSPKHKLYMINQYNKRTI